MACLFTFLEMKEQSDLIKTLSENIKKARETMHITQVKLAESSGVSVSHIVDIEECKTWVSEKTFSAIAKALNMEAHELLMPDNSGKNLLNKFLTDAVLELHYFLTQSEREANKKKQAEGIAAARARGAPPSIILL